MWIEDLTKALWELNASDEKWKCCVEKIENGIIYMTNHTFYRVDQLVKQYDECYGPKGE